MLAEHYDVTLITNGAKQDFSSLLNENVHFINVDIARKISLLNDMAALFQLYRVFRKEHFEVVHSIMPKSGLLAMLAAFVAGVPYRIHTFTGQVWANKVGFPRWGLKMLDKLIATCATGLLTDSFTQRLFLIEQHVVDQQKIVVLGNGSICGVDAERFKANLIVRNQIRSSLGIPEKGIVYLFLGRLNNDKGILDLAHAFADLAGSMPNAYLLVVGPDEEGMDIKLRSILQNCSNKFHRIDFTNRPEDYMASADIFCLPSYREGFGSVIIEAAAVGLPAVASNIYGIQDAVKDGETGMLHQPKNIEAIKQALMTLSNDDVMRGKMSKQAMERAHDFFARDVVVSAMRNYYQSKLNLTIE